MTVQAVAALEPTLLLPTDATSHNRILVLQARCYLELVQPFARCLAVTHERASNESQNPVAAIADTVLTLTVLRHDLLRDKLLGMRL